MTHYLRVLEIVSLPSSTNITTTFHRREGEGNFYHPLTYLNPRRTSSKQLNKSKFDITDDWNTLSARAVKNFSQQHLRARFDLLVYRRAIGNSFIIVTTDRYTRGKREQIDTCTTINEILLHTMLADL